MSYVSTTNSLQSFSSVAARSAFAVVVGLLAVSSAAGVQICKPALEIKDVQFSRMSPPMERKWTAMVSVDASRCAANSSGYFEIAFSRLKENAPEVEFREHFIWLEFKSSPSMMKVGVDFWADEAAEQYWLENVTPCPCRD